MAVTSSTFPEFFCPFHHSSNFQGQSNSQYGIKSRKVDDECIGVHAIRRSVDPHSLHCLEFSHHPQLQRSSEYQCPLRVRVHHLFLVISSMFVGLGGLCMSLPSRHHPRGSFIIWLGAASCAPTCQALLPSLDFSLADKLGGLQSELFFLASVLHAQCCFHTQSGVSKMWLSV